MVNTQKAKAKFKLILGGLSLMEIRSVEYPNAQLRTPPMFNDRNEGGSEEHPSPKLEKGKKS